MILQALWELYKRDTNPLPHGYEVRPVRWVVRLTSAGRPRDKQAVAVEKRLVVPVLKRSGTSAPPTPFADMAKYVFGCNARDPEKAAEYERMFARLAADCAAQTDNALLQIAAEAIGKGVVRRCCPPEAEPTHYVDIEVDGTRVCTIPALEQLWAHMVAGHSSQRRKGQTATCLVTGIACTPTRVFPLKLQGIPAGRDSKTKRRKHENCDLVSFNQDSFRSYGLQKSCNAPVSLDVALGTARAFNALRQDPSSHIVFDDQVMVFWTRRPEPLSFMHLLETPQPGQVRALIESVRRGPPPRGVEANGFYLLGVSAQRSRAVVRDFIHLQLGAAQTHACNWFEKARLEDCAGSHMYFGLSRLASSLYRHDDEAAFRRDGPFCPSQLPALLARCALTASPLPPALLGLAVQRNIAERGPYVTIHRNKVEERYLSYARLALIRAVIRDLIGEDIMTTQTDPLDRQAFNCGRLLAVLDNLYLHFVNADKARGEKWMRPKTTVSSRYYGAAASSPASVFGNLLHGSRHHLAKLRGNDKDLNHELKLEEIVQAIGTAFPLTLDLRRQGTFALGYYHQMAADRAARAKSGIPIDEGTDEGAES